MRDDLEIIEGWLSSAIQIVRTERDSRLPHPRTELLRQARRWVWDAAVGLADLLAPHGHASTLAARLEEDARPGPIARTLVEVVPAVVQDKATPRMRARAGTSPPPASSAAAASDTDVELASAMLAAHARGERPAAAWPPGIVVLARRFVLAPLPHRGIDAVERTAPEGCRLRIVVAPAGWPIITISTEGDDDRARVHPVFAPLGIPEASETPTGP